MHWTHDTNAREVRPFRYLSVWLRIRGRCSTFDARELDIPHHMGGLRTVPRSLDCCKALPCTATIIEKMGYRRISLSLNKNSRALLYSVSPHLECIIFSAEVPRIIGLLLCLALTSAISLRSCRCVNLLLTSACGH